MVGLDQETGKKLIKKRDDRLVAPVNI